MKEVLVKLKVVKGALVPINLQNDKLLKQFLSLQLEGSYVSMYIEQESGDKTNTQLAKLHSCVRELAVFTGTTFEEMKDAIKYKTGLYLSTESGLVMKSFGDCSKEEISLAIQTCITEGARVGIYF